MAGFIERLRDDPALHERARALKAELLDHPALAGYLHGLWDELLGWLRDELGRDDSDARRRLERLLAGIGRRLQADDEMRAWIDVQLLVAAPAWVEAARAGLVELIGDEIEAWDDTLLAAEIERHIGRDLQFIRVNGTLVGGLVGLAIHALGQWLQAG
jgi:uncharacterized membrane-anchored protein YjiN (DUF445 family)